MHYFIDGYNLMFRVLRAGDDLQSQRASIIRDLSRKILATGLNATLVFDAQYQSGESSRSHVKDLEIYFTDQGESADEFILKQLRLHKDPQRQVVVTSDKKLAWLARRKGAQTETVEVFLKQLNNRYKNRLARPKQAALKTMTPPTQIKPVALPAPSSPEEQSLYYLNQFEVRYQELIKHLPEKKTAQKPRQKKSKRPRKGQREEGLSEAERWLKAFERDPQEEDNF